MVSLQLYSRGDAKKYTKLLFAKITDCDYTGARIVVKKLKTCLLEYFLTRGVDCSNIHDVFNEFDYLLLVCSPGPIKQQLCSDFFKKIIAINQLIVHNPLDRFHQLYEDLRHAYLNLNDKNSFDTILDCFDEVRTLKPAIEKIGGTTYNYYTQTLVEMGKCESILLDISISGKLDNKKTTMDAFQNLFSTIQKVIAPPVMIRVTPVELSQQIKQGKSLEELSEATGHREEELQAMLNQIELGGGE